jgi:hypothetical protein
MIEATTAGQSSPSHASGRRDLRRRPDGSAGRREAYAEIALHTLHSAPGRRRNANQETATIAQVQGGRGGVRITVTAPLKIAHPAGTPLAGSGITLTMPLGRAHPRGTVVPADLPTPGVANKYPKPRAIR